VPEQLNRSNDRTGDTNIERHIDKLFKQRGDPTWERGMRLPPHGDLTLQFCRFESNRPNNVLVLFTSSGSQTITCLFFVNNTCGNNSDYGGLIYVKETRDGIAE
jgi:hypothetical protein